MRLQKQAEALIDQQVHDCVYCHRVRSKSVDVRLVEMPDHTIGMACLDCVPMPTPQRYSRQYAENLNLKLF